MNFSRFWKIDYHLLWLTLVKFCQVLSSCFPVRHKQRTRQPEAASTWQTVSGRRQIQMICSEKGSSLAAADSRTCLSISKHSAYDKLTQRSGRANMNSTSCPLLLIWAIVSNITLHIKTGVWDSLQNANEQDFFPDLKMMLLSWGHGDVIHSFAFMWHQQHQFQRVCKFLRVKELFSVS